MQASTRGTTRRWIGSMPSTIIASSSSRILRAPRSAAIAEPPAPAMRSEVAVVREAGPIATSLLIAGAGEERGRDRPGFTDDREHRGRAGERLGAELLDQATHLQ